MSEYPPGPRNAAGDRLNPPSPRSGVRLPVGRPKGSMNTATRLAQAFASSILDTEEYKQSLMRRIRADTLAPAVEVLLHHYKYGKPKDTIEVVRPDGRVNLDAAAAAILAQEARQLAEEMEEIQLKAEEQKAERERIAEEKRVAAMQKAAEEQRLREEAAMLEEAARIAIQQASTEFSQGPM